MRGFGLSWEEEREDMQICAAMDSQRKSGIVAIGTAETTSTYGQYINGAFVPTGERTTTTTVEIILNRAFESRYGKGFSWRTSHDAHLSGIYKTAAIAKREANRMLNLRFTWREVRVA